MALYSNLVLQRSVELELSSLVRERSVAADAMPIERRAAIDRRARATLDEKSTRGRGSGTSTKGLYTEGFFSMTRARYVSCSNEMVYRRLPGDAIRLIAGGIKEAKGHGLREVCGGGRGNESCEHYRSSVYPSYWQLAPDSDGPSDLDQQSSIGNAEIKYGSETTTMFRQKERFLRTSLLRCESVGGCKCRYVGGRKQVYNPAGIMQRAGKRSADSRITLATVAGAGLRVDRKRKGESGVYLATDLTGTRPYFRFGPKVAYSVNPGNIEIARLEVRGWSRKWCRVGFPREDGFAPSRMVFVPVTFVPRG
ncbi:hypothetical protein DBV15_05438 [Temnothorax longispinosus]|uniref:Uncharacterized protein n=1 Tax=Temnothorax longispinosus TaxID=300112 RepID=A0A4S2KAU0_9HYME|nr:hypothetical protein DBV15_05438 [Temnothorax longispinosus]